MKTLNTIIKLKFLLILLLFLGCNDDKFHIDNSFKFEVKAEFENTQVYFENTNPLKIFIDPTRELKEQKYKIEYELLKGKGTFETEPNLITSKGNTFLFIPKEEGDYEIVINAWDGKENRSETKPIKFNVKKETYELSLKAEETKINFEEKAILRANIEAEYPNPKQKYITTFKVTNGTGNMLYKEKIIKEEEEFVLDSGDNFLEFVLESCTSNKIEVAIYTKDIYQQKEKKFSFAKASLDIIRKEWDYKADFLSFENEQKMILYFDKNTRIVNRIKPFLKKPVNYILTFEIGNMGQGTIEYNKKIYNAGDEIPIDKEDFNIYFKPKKGGKFEQELILNLKDNQGFEKKVSLNYTVTNLIEVNKNGTYGYERRWDKGIGKNSTKSAYWIYWDFKTPPPASSFIVFTYEDDKVTENRNRYLKFSYNNKKSPEQVRGRIKDEKRYNGDIHLEIFDREGGNLLYKEENVAIWYSNRDGGKPEAPDTDDECEGEFTEDCDPEIIPEPEPESKKIRIK